MKTPSDPQRALMRQIVGHGGDLASTLNAQFAGCRTASEEHCAECFSIEVDGNGPLLPANTECPLTFNAETSGVSGVGNALQVLLWHENGRIDNVEISSVIHPHPAVGDLRILASH